jgi:tetratricopeptide (TPR) repeat protein
MKANRLLLVLFAFSINCLAQGQFSENKKINRSFERAEKHYKKQKFEMAKSVYEKAVNDSDGTIRPEAYYLQGNIEFALKNYEDAKMAYFNLIKNSDFNDPNRNIGQIAISRCIAGVERMVRSREKKIKSEEKRLSNASNPEKSKAAKPVADEIIEVVPIFPGCEVLLGNKLLKNCMQRNVGSWVANNYQQNLIRSIGMNSPNKIMVSFKINSKGKIVGVDASASNPLMEIEAIRVMKQLPNMIPGFQDGKPVGVIYGLPIVLQIQ